MKVIKKIVENVNVALKSNQTQFFSEDLKSYQKNLPVALFDGKRKYVEPRVSEIEFKLSIEKVKSWLYSSKFIYPTYIDDALEITFKETKDSQEAVADGEDMNLEFSGKENSHNSHNNEKPMKKKITYLRSHVIQNIDCDLPRQRAQISSLPGASKDKTSNDRAESYQDKKLIEKLEQFQMDMRLANNENDKCCLRIKRKSSVHLNLEVRPKRTRLSNKL